MIGAAVAGLAAAGIAAHGTWYRNSVVFGPVLTHLAGDEPVVSITFDDGPNPRATPRILEVLRRERVHATFFVLGRHAERWPDLVRRAALDGHQLGNHGYYHRKLHRRSPGYVRDDITRGTEQIVRASGVRPHHFRAPHGFRSPWVTPIAASHARRIDPPAARRRRLRSRWRPHADRGGVASHPRRSPEARISLYDAPGLTGANR